MTVLHLIPKATAPHAAPGVAAAVVDIIRERKAMLIRLGHTLAVEDALDRGEMLSLALMMLDAASVAAALVDKRRLLVSGVAHAIAEIERIDRLTS